MASRAEKLAEARRRQEEEAKAEAERKAVEEEAKRQAALERKAAAKKAADEARRDYEEFDGKIFCSFTGELIEKSMWDDHLLSIPAEIRDRLYLGSGEMATDETTLRRIGVTHILNCTHEIECPKHISKMLVGFKRIKLSDRVADSIMEHMKEALVWCDEVMSKKDTCLFIHCREGKSRSASFLCAFLMWKGEMSFPSALGMVRGKRSIAMPNPKFFQQLEELDKILQIERSPECEIPPADRQFPPSAYKYKLKPPTGSTLTDASRPPEPEPVAPAKKKKRASAAATDDSKSSEDATGSKKKKKGASAAGSSSSSSGGRASKKGAAASSAAGSGATKKKKKKAGAS